MGRSPCPVLTVCGWSSTESNPSHCAAAPAAEMGAQIASWQAGGKVHKLFDTSPQTSYDQLGLLTSSPEHFWMSQSNLTWFLGRVRNRKLPLHPRPSLSMPGFWSPPPTTPPCLGCLHCWWQSSNSPKWDPAKHISTAWPPVRAHASAFTVPKSNNPAKQFLASQKFQSTLIKFCKKNCLGNPFWYPWTGSVLKGCYFISSFACIFLARAGHPHSVSAPSQGHTAQRFSRALDYCCWCCNTSTISSAAFQ